MSEGPDTERQRFGFSLRALLVVITAVGIGIAVGLSVPQTHPPFLAVLLVGPSCFLVNFFMFMSDTHVAFSFATGLLYGIYALLALKPIRWVILGALVVHALLTFLVWGMVSIGH